MMVLRRIGGQTVFCNPPYSRRTKGKSGQEDWIEKCCRESRENGITAVMLFLLEPTPKHSMISFSQMQNMFALSKDD